MAYRPLTTDTVAPALLALGLAERVGGPPSAWRVREVGDGNLNLVFIAEGEAGGVVVKQALPYVRLVGESWPLPLDRSFYEAEALKEQARHAPGLTPDVYYASREQALIVMEYLHPHIILRKGLIQGVRYPKAAAAISEFMAATLFHTSALASTAAQHKARVERFAPNTELCKITEDLVFTDPYRVAALNRWTTPRLDGVKARFERDGALKAAVQRKKWQFMTEAQALIHGDLHTGSIMATQDDTRMIDPEFAFVGPMAFDTGAVTANFLLSFFAHAGRPDARTGDESFAAWTAGQIDSVWTGFERRFLDLWATHGAGDAYGQALFAAEPEALEAARRAFMRTLFTETLEFAACKMIRRILGLAHVADLETIADPDVRGHCETLALEFARRLILESKSFSSMAGVAAAARASIRKP